ncbi:MAG TPA: RDD family protein [Flavobacterium sp.]|nr:RDD family protein [Flavobacterium sp.]HRA73247.1 RDD family protein [Flavobacterium sp.]
MNQENISTKPNILKRLGAFSIDYCIIFSFTILIMSYFGTSNEDGSTSVKGFPGLAPILFWFLWIIFPEQFYGSTLGNRLLGLKVISIKNPNTTNLTFGQSFKRHFLDTFDAVYFIGLILLKNTKYNQRLGDIWAKTIVIDTEDKEQFYKKF